MTDPTPEGLASIPARPAADVGGAAPVYKGLPLDPFQSEAIRHIEDGRSVIVAAPTGAGKTLIAEYALERALQSRRRLVYTAPIKALSNQKFRDFTRDYGERIGIVTGDVVLNPGAQVLIMTTEIYRNTLFDDASRLDDVEYVIFDEVHYMDDSERGTVWEESIIFSPPHVRFLALSATIPNLQHFAAWIRRIRNSPVEIVEELRRPVPLQHQLYIQGLGLGTLGDLQRLDSQLRHGKFSREQDWRRILHGEDRDLISDPGSKNWRRRLLDDIQGANRLPCLYFLFNRRECRERAMENRFRRLLDGGAVERVTGMVAELAERYQLGPESGIAEVRELAQCGIAYHHAGMLPTLKEVVERLFTSGLIKLLFATETFAMGVNMPARTVVFDTLHKFDGVRRTFLKTREYQQMAGRAGRRGMDAVGFVYANVEWPFMDSGTVRRILEGETEPVRSQFNLSYSTLLSLYQRLGREIYRACEKSYSNFQEGAAAPPPRQEGRRRREHRRGRDRRPERVDRLPAGVGYSGMVDQVRRRLQALRALGYVQGDQLTRKGEFASRINGYELHVTEFLDAELFDSLHEDQINVLMTAVIFESKKGEWYRKPTPEMLPGSRRRALERLDEVHEAERSCGVRTLSKTLDFRLSSAAWAWSRGEAFSDMGRHTSASDGDLVRVFRQVIQMLRQVARALGPQDRLVRKLERCMRRMHRDEVDATRQLRQD